MTKIKLKAGIAGKALVQVLGKGAGLRPPNPALTLPVTAELLIRQGTQTTCSATPYPAARENDDQVLLATAP